MKHSATLIDNMFISQKLQDNYKSGILTNDISDHLPCYLVLLEATNHKPSLQKISYRTFSDRVKMQICNSIKAVDWQTELKLDDVNAAFKTFHSKLINTIEKFAPIKTKYIKPNKQPKAKWLTTGIINSENKNKELYKKSVLANATSENKNKYALHNKLLMKIKRQAKLNNYSNKCEELINNGSKLWKLINKVTNKTPNKQSIINKINIDGIKIVKPREISNALAKYFATIGNKLSNNLPPSGHSIKHYINKIPTCPATMYANPTDPAEVNDLILNLANKYGSGHDDISNHMLKWLRPLITEPLSVLFNLSIQQGVFPRSYEDCRSCTIT